MTNANHYDVIIIGTGAGGGTLLHALAPTGKRILVLERGGYIPRERENWDSKTVFIEGKYTTQERWRDSAGKEFQPGTHYYVGGNTKFFGAALLRMRREDFGELKHHGGVSPSWPLGYDDFERYYCDAEELYHVHGERGQDPTEPVASRPYPHPAVSHEPRIQELHDDFKRVGLRPFHVPLGIRLNEKDRHKSECIRCAACDGFPCVVNAKSDAQITCVDPAVDAHSNVTLLTDALVKRLDTSTSGREVTAVQAERDGVQETYTGNIVVASCGAINSAALLLRSANDKHPNGLGNTSGAVGRHYMCHNNSAMLALSTRENPTVFQKTLAINDFYFGSDDFQFPLGHIQMLGKSDQVMLSAEAPSFAPGVVLDQMAKRSLDFWMTSEDLPLPDNRVTIDPDGKIRLSYKTNNEEGHKRLTAKLKGLLSKIGCEDKLICTQMYLGKKIPLAGVAHQCGTIRFGTEPQTSALNTNCRAHDVDNLYVVDGSFFPSSSAVNPALTIIANALRVADHLKERLK